MLDTTDFLSDPIPSKIQTGIGDTDPIPILCANTTNAGVPTLFCLVTLGQGG